MSIYLKQGDITTMQVDIIVNAANSDLRGGGGVDGAIHRAGGSAIMKECKMIGVCPTGEAVITTAGNLPSKKVIHTVGPIWEGGKNNEDFFLKSAYSKSLKLAIDYGFNSIAFPNISTGIYGFPKHKAAGIAISTVKEFINNHPDVTVYFVCFDDENYQIYQQLLTEK